MAAVRRADGFRRYACSIQYHGSSFLGFTSQGEYENCILPDGTDLRGLRSVEETLAEALGACVGCGEWENLQVSSRTDRGVHALHNTLHFDVRHNPHEDWSQRLHRGINFHLKRQEPWFSREQQQLKRKRSKHTRLGDYWCRYDPMNEVRILRVKPAPDYMANKEAFQPPETIDWNARYSATQRTYLYRVLHSTGYDMDWAAAFEWDRSWRVHERAGRTGLDVEAMAEAASYLTGEHDFTSFRGKGCNRMSPVVSLEDIRIEKQDMLLASYLFREASNPLPGHTCQLIHFFFSGNAFLYRQVRNLTGCLVEVGRGRLAPTEIPGLLAARDRSQCPGMAPPHGLFLVNVQHGDFSI